MKSLLAATAALALLTQSCPQPWKDKDPAQWNAEECDRVLRFSPWVHYEEVGPVTRYVEYVPGAPVETIVGGGWSSVVELSSALPVRLATRRWLEINVPLPQVQNVLAQSPFNSLQADYSEIMVVSYGDAAGWSFLFAQSAPDVSKGRTFRSALILADGRVILPQSEGVTMPMGIPVTATFPRYVDGKPIHELSGRHIVVARGKFSASETKIDRTYKFKISDLVYRGKIEY